MCELTEAAYELFSPIGVVVILICSLIGYVLNHLDLIYQHFHPADVESPDHGGNIVAQVLKAHDVNFIFTLCGGHISPISVGCEKLGIRVVDTRHEVTAAFAADGAARLTRNIGVALVTAGPGVTNTVTAMKNAQMAESPVLLIGGAAATVAKGRGALQDVDQLSVLKSICKHSVSISRVRDIAPMLRKAISIAKSGTPGPVFVEMPIDILYSYKMVLKEALGGMQPKTLALKVINWYLHKYVGRIFAGGFEPVSFDPLPVDLPLAKVSDVQRAAELLSKSKRPVFVIGSQIICPPADLNEIAKIIEDMSVPTFLGGMARGLLGADSNVQCRHCRRDALRDADFVLLAGTVCDFRLSYGRVLPKKASIVAVNRSNEQLTKNARVMWNPTLSIKGDVGSFFISLQLALREYKADISWLSRWRDADSKKEENIEKKANLPVDKGLNPLSLLSSYNQVLNSNSLLIADGGDFVGSASYIVKPTKPLGWLDPGAFGTLGVGAGFALAAKLCQPAADVWVIFGDGSFGYSLAEFDTFVRHNIPVMAIIGNDACWSQILREQSVTFNTNVACKLAYTEYHNVVEALGGNGVICDEGLSTTEIRQRIEDARNTALTSSKPAVINCIIGKTDFRDGSVSI